MTNPEAPYSVTYRVENGKVTSALWTCRGFDVLEDFMNDAGALRSALTDTQPDVMEPSTPATVALPAPEEGDNEPIEVVKFTLAKRTDGKFQLELYKNYGDNPGKYPELKFTADRERMWAMIDHVLLNESLDLPVEHAVSWYADWGWGKEYTKKDGTPGRYQDLVRLRAR